MGHIEEGIRLVLRNAGVRRARAIRKGKKVGLRKKGNAVADRVASGLMSVNSPVPITLGQVLANRGYLTRKGGRLLGKPLKAFKKTTRESYAEALIQEGAQRIRQRAAGQALGDIPHRGSERVARAVVPPEVKLFDKAKAAKMADDIGAARVRNVQARAKQMPKTVRANRALHHKTLSQIIRKHRVPLAAFGIGGGLALLSGN